MNRAEEVAERYALQRLTAIEIGRQTGEDSTEVLTRAYATAHEIALPVEDFMSWELRGLWGWR